MNTAATLKTIMLAITASCSLPAAYAQCARDAAPSGAPGRGNAALAATPLLFTENRGQAVDDAGNLRPDILFTAHSGGAKVFLTATGIHYQFTRRDYAEGQQEERMAGSQGMQDAFRSPVKTSTHRFTLLLEGANPHPHILKEGQSAYTENFYLAHCPQGITGVHTYSRITLEEVYPGIDWIIYTIPSSGGSLAAAAMEYDFIVKPGADPAQIKLLVKDADAVAITADGGLLMQTSLGAVTEAPPVSFGSGRSVATRFIQRGDGSISFALGAYDKAKPLTIDPSITWATYYGGTGNDAGTACATDAAGNVYLVGNTTSTAGIASSGGFQTAFGGGSFYNDAFVVKFNAAGSRLWATYYGGDRMEQGNACATDAAGNVYLAGTTYSSIGIASGGAQNIKSDSNDAFLVKFSSTGTRQWATYFGGTGGTGDDRGYGCATDKAGNVFLAGFTESATGVGSGGFQNTYGGGISDAFLVKYNAAGAKQWSTYYGGSSIEYGYSCATDTGGNVYLAGITGSTTGVGSAGTAQPLYGGGYSDAFVVKFSSTGARVWGTYYGGTDEDRSYPVYCATDAAGNVFLSGTTLSLTGIASGGFQNTFGGFRDDYLVKFNSAGIRKWATYYGGTDDEIAYSCATDPSGNVFLTGVTSSTTGIASGGFQNSFTTGAAGYIAKFDSAGARQWGSYYVGATACAADGSGNVYLAGAANPTPLFTTGGYQNTFGGGQTDAFLAKIADNGVPQGIGAVPGNWEGDISLYPNPACGAFVIAGEVNAAHAGREISVTLINSIGQCVYVCSFTPRSGHFIKEIAVGNAVANGLYQVRLNNGGRVGVKAVVIQR